MQYARLDLRFETEQISFRKTLERIFEESLDIGYGFELGK